MNNKISKLRKFFNEQCKLGDKMIIKRKRKLTTKNILYFLFKIIGNNSSFSLTNSLLKVENIVNTSCQSISFRLYDKAKLTALAV